MSPPLLTSQRDRHPDQVLEPTADSQANSPCGPEAETAVARGRRAEILAHAHLEQCGYRMVACNHYCPGGEVDVVAWHEGVLCFIEIRARASDRFGHPLETIGAAKIARVVRAASHFLESWRGHLPAMRFDALGILLTEPPQFFLVQEAFLARTP